MKPYLAILSSRFRTLLQYRAAAMAGIGTQLFFGLVRMMIFDAFYDSAHGPQPLSHADAISYIWLGQALLLLAMLSVDSDVALMIRNGNVAYEMTRPVDLYFFWFARAFSGRAAPLTMRALPILVVSALLFGLQPPATVEAAVLFALSCIGALLLAAAMVALMTISMLWTISGEGISRLAPALIFFFSGIVVPLPLLPDWIQASLRLMPFTGLLDTPIRLYLGHLSGPDAATALLSQIFWIVALIALGRAALKRGLGKLVVQGG
jgi:ABC-2 type transport system permease protein